uniref:Glycosyltransferase N-terminal domain-containing protein n=1 Tax=Solanum lycopersicum TaxID=4081 RepID=A0A3Q7IJX6_SOLLC
MFSPTYDSRHSQKLQIFIKLQISKHFPMAENYPMKSNGKKGIQDAHVAVVMVPLPAQGHLNQLLHLSRLISLYNIPVHYVGATT